MYRITTCELSLTLDQLDVAPEDIAKLMGYSTEVPREILEIIATELDNMNEVVGIKGGYRIFNAIFEREGYKMKIGNKEFCLGRQVWNRLKNANGIAIFVCTAGEIISRRAKQLMDQGDALGGYVADVMGSVLVEKIKGKLHRHLIESIAPEGLSATNSYCPGYCTWGVHEQRILFSFLPERFCQVSLSDFCMMQPVKSLSGVIGVGRNLEYVKHDCSTCGSVTCIYRNMK